MCNASLLEGHLPVSQRHAIITPLIKKSNLDATDVKNYRPVSNLTFVSKVVERLVSERLVGFLQENNLMPVEQSAYRKHHSTEKALLLVISDLLSSMDKQEVMLLGLLDLSAALDCVDHDILLSRLMICGDFNLPSTSPDTVDNGLAELLHSTSFSQFVKSPTRHDSHHDRSSLLDFIITPSSSKLVTVTSVVSSHEISEHDLTLTNLSTKSYKSPPRT